MVRLDLISIKEVLEPDRSNLNLSGSDALLNAPTFCSGSLVLSDGTTITFASLTAEATLNWKFH